MWSNKRKFEVRRMFKSADENGDGALESDEILWLCGKMGEARIVPLGIGTLLYGERGY